MWETLGAFFFALGFFLTCLGIVGSVAKRH